jgi:hypothetical protein
VLLVDYGISSPESISILYRFMPGQDFFEVKRYTSLDRSGDWCPFLSWDEVKELYEVSSQPSFISLITLFSSLFTAVARGSSIPLWAGDHPTGDPSQS